MKTSLSVVASKVYRTSKSLGEAHADIDAMHAPSECHALVRDGERIKDAIESCGWEIGEFFEELESRTSPRFVYFHFGYAASAAADVLEP